MDQSKEPILDEFGALLMKHVRDEAFSYLQRVLSGKMADKSSKVLFDRFKELDPGDAEFVGHLLAIAVDAGIVQFLYFLDQFEIEVIYSGKDGESHDIRAISDGLHGEVWNEDGWIERFSAFKDRIEAKP